MRDSAALEALNIPAVVVLPEALVQVASDAALSCGLAARLVALEEPLYGRSHAAITAAAVRLKQQILSASLAL